MEINYFLSFADLLKIYLFFLIAFLGEVVVKANVVIDHNCTDPTKIPSYFIEEIKNKNMLVQSLGESHGAQIYHGLLLLEEIDQRFSVQIGDNLSDLDESGALRILTSQFQNMQWSGNSFGDEKYWSTEQGRNLTEVSVSQALEQGQVVDVSLWTWCWDICRPEYFFSQADYFDDTHINVYLNAIQYFNDNINNTLFAYVTSISDCSCYYNPDGPWRISYYNEIIRQKAINDNLILFDQADIENWNIENTEQYSYTDTSGRLVYTRHYDYSETNMPDTYSGDHANDALCIRKAVALWWLLARFLGWDGEYQLEGDVNHDGKIDFEDLRVFYTHWLDFNCQEPSWCGCSDIDRNGMVNMLDYTQLAKKWMERLLVAGDVDGDRKITFVDLGAMSQHWLDEGCKYPDYCGCVDVDRSGKVDLVDFSILAESWMFFSGDFNCNCKVDFEDVECICKHWLESKSESFNFLAHVDINHDEVINFDDMAILADNWLK